MAKGGASKGEVQKTPNVDRPFLEYIWKWLIQSSDVSVGQHDQYRNLTLAEAEASYQLQQPSNPDGNLPHTPSDSRDQVCRDEADIIDEIGSGEASAGDKEASTKPIASDQEMIGQPHVPATKSSDSGVFKAASVEKNQPIIAPENNGTPDEPVAEHAIRLFASEDRVWHALTGHGPDHTRVKELDLNLLSIISNHKAKGILQNDLVKISGQDKRSLPNRTDRLHEHGYIEKKKVVAVIWDGRHNRKLPTSICVLKRFAKDPQHKRELERLAAVEAGTQSLRQRRKRRANRHPSIKHSNDPTDLSIELQGARVSPALEYDVAETVTDMIIPQWTPDRSMANQIYDIIKRSGIEGVTIPELRDTLMGDEYKKPIESVINRLVEIWQVSQPLHLRHLAIVRDTVLRGKSPIYIHYTYGNFKKIVDAGKASWKAVTTIVATNAKEATTMASLDSRPNLDEHGFPVLDAKHFQGRTHDATLADCAAIVRNASSRDTDQPILRHPQRQVMIHGSINGGKEKAFNGVPGHRDSLQEASGTNVSDDNEPPIKRSTTVTKGVGRPRKYAKAAALPHSLGKMPLGELRKIHRSQDMAAKYQKTKIVAEIKRRIELGEDSQMVVKAVLQEMDDLIELGNTESLFQHVREEILHEHAAGPPPRPSELHVELSKRLSVRTSKPKNRGKRKPHPQQDYYHPSIAAHTHPIPIGPALHLWTRTAKSNVQDTELLDSRTRKRKIVLPEELLEPHKKKIKKRRRIEHDLPCPVDSIADDCLPDHDVSVTHTAPATSTDGLSMFVRPKRERTIPEMMAKRYAEETRKIDKPHDGFYSGKTEELTKRKAESPVKTPIKYKLAIFRLVQLQSLDWFVPTPNTFDLGYPKASQGPSTSATSQSHGEYGTKSRDAEPPSDPYSPPPEPDAVSSIDHHSFRNEAEPFNLPDEPPAAAAPVLQPPSPPSSMRLSPSAIPQSEPVDNSLYAKGSGERRKRKRTSHLTADEEPFPSQPWISSNASSLIESEPVKRKRGRPRKVSRGPQQRRSPQYDIPSISQPPALIAAEESVPSHSLDSFSAPSLLRPRFGRPPQGGGSPDQRSSPQHGIPDGVRNNGHDQVLSQDPITKLPNEADPSYVGAVNVVERGLPMSDHSTINETCDLRQRVGAQTWSNMESAEAIAKYSMWIKLTTDKVHLQGLLQANENKENKEIPTANVYAKEKGNCIPIEVHDGRSEGSRCSLWLKLKVGSALLQRFLEPHTLDTKAPNAGSDSVAVEKAQDQEQSFCKSTIPRPRNQRSHRNSHSEAISVVGINRKGGSTAILREDIILELVHKCGGASPGHTELAVAFAVEWSKRGQPGQPERNTVKNAVNNLCKARRLRQLTFAHQTKGGLTKSSTILTLPEIDPEDPRVRKVRDEISRNSPRVYLPNEWLINDDVRAVNDEPTVTVSSHSPRPPRETQASHRLKWHKQLLQKSERAEEDQALKTQALMERDRRRAEKAASRYKASRKALVEKLAGKRSLEQFDGLQRHGTSSWTAYSDPTRDPGSKAILPMAPSGTFADIIFQDSSTMTWQISQPSATKKLHRRSYIRQKKPLLEPIRPLYSLTGPSVIYPNFKSNIVHQQAGPQHDILKQRSRVSWIGTSPENLDMDMTTDEESISDTSASSQSESGNTQTLPSIIPATQRPIIVGELADTSRKRRNLIMPSYMDPKQVFYGANGTFSTEFNGIPPSVAKPFRVVPEYTRRSKLTGNGEAEWNVQSRTKESLFEIEVEKVKRLELELPGLQDIKYTSWPFVNYYFPHFHTSVASGIALIDSGMMYVANQKGRIGAKAMARFLERGTEAEGVIVGKGTRFIPRKYYLSTEKSMVEQSPRLKRKRRRVAPKLQALDHEDFGGDEGGLQHAIGPIPARSRRLKGPLDSRTLTDEEEQRVITAVVAIRCLTGGVERRIDWALVAIVFEPDRDQRFIHARWNHIREKFKTGLVKTEADFQELFIKAYEEGVVPSIDFDHPEAYPWKWLVQWIMENSEPPTRSVPDLPLNRDTFLDNYSLDIIDENEMSQFFEINGPRSSHARRSIINKHGWTYPLQNTSPSTLAQETSDVAIAKTWVRANVATPHETYDPDIARATLLAFPEQTIELALDDLLADKLLTQENKGRLVPGRNYFLNEYSFARLQKNISASTFHRAANFKAQLDTEFSLHGMAEYSPHAPDGDVMAVLNLLAAGRIMLRPKDIPMNRFGQTDGGYETRQMDKTRLYCNVAIYPLPAYIPGNPLLPLPPPPSRHLEPPPLHPSNTVHEKQRIPLWYDIHENLIHPLWEIALAAVTTLVVTRPGIGAKQVATDLRPCMEAWEIEWVLDWMVEAGMATARGEGEGRRWVTGEWWWLILGGEGRDEVGSVREMGDAE